MAANGLFAVRSSAAGVCERTVRSTCAAAAFAELWPLGKHKMPRSLTFLGIFQLACLLIGFLALGIVLKMCGYPEEHPVIRWSPFAILLRSYGLWLILLPALWITYAVYSCRRDEGIFSKKISVLVGVVLSGAIILSFLYAAVFPFSRVMLVLP